jgi:hypothetical protein
MRCTEVDKWTSEALSPSFKLTDIYFYKFQLPLKWFTSPLVHFIEDVALPHKGA